MTVIKIWPTGRRDPSSHRLVLGDAQRGLGTGIFPAVGLVFPIIFLTSTGEWLEISKSQKLKITGKCSGAGRARISFFSPEALLTREAVKKSLLEKATRKRRNKEAFGLDPGQWACVPCTTTTDDPRHMYLIPLRPWLLSLFASSFWSRTLGLSICAKPSEAAQPTEEGWRLGCHSKPRHGIKNAELQQLGYTKSQCPCTTHTQLVFQSLSNTTSVSMHNDQTPLIPL